jgi:hypothetical protein
MSVAIVKWRGICPCGTKAYHLGMRRLNRESSDSESSDRSLPADVLLREEPDEEEDDEEPDSGEEDDDGHEGYSE